MAKTLLNERVVVVVGGTTGLGLSAAQAFLTAGAKGVVITGRGQSNADAALAILGPRARALTGDACEPTHAQQAITLALEAFASFDGLYHVAGGSGRKFGDGPLHEVSDEAIMATLEWNLASVILSNRAAVASFQHRQVGGAIVNMGSVLGYSPSPRYFASHVYAAAKAGIIGFTKAIAAYYAPSDIRANVLAPALVQTPMAQRAAHDETILRFVVTKQPLHGGRIGRPDDCDGAAVFLLSEQARYITGQVLAIDGGWTVSEGQYSP